jgi:hypothetical protein
MFVLRKTTSAAVKRLDNKRVHALVRLLNSRSTFQSQVNVPQYQACQQISAILPQESDVDSSNKNLESSLQFDNIKLNSPPLVPLVSVGTAEPPRACCPNVVPVSFGDTTRDSSLRALNDASLRLLRSALASTNNGKNIFAQTFDTSMGISFSSPRNFQRESRVFYSSGPVKKGGTYSTPVKVPTPKSSQSSLSPFGSFDPKELTKKAMEMTWSLTKMILMFLIRLPGNTFFLATHPKARKDKIAEIKEIVQHEIDHYWTGTKVCGRYRTATLETIY